MAFAMTTHEIDGALVLDLSGRLTLGDAIEDLREPVRQFLDDGNRAFVLNLAEVSYMDSAGLGQVVASYVSARNKRGHVVLLTPSRRSEELLKISKLSTIFDIYDDEATAVEAVNRQVAN